MTYTKTTCLMEDIPTQNTREANLAINAISHWFLTNKAVIFHELVPRIIHANLGQPSELGVFPLLSQIFCHLF